MLTGVRRRLTAPVAVGYVLAPPTLLVWFTATASQLAALGVVVVTGMQVLNLVVFAAPQAAYTHLVRNRVPFLSQLPAERWATLIGLPVATSLGATLSALGGVLASGSVMRPVGIELIGFGLVTPVVVGWVATLRALREQRGEAMALYDETLPARKRLERATARFDELLAEQRYLLPRQRTRWLGSVAAAPERAWPMRWRGHGGARFLAPRYVVPCLPLLTAIVVAVAVAVVAPLGRIWHPYVLIAPSSAAVAMLNLVLRVFTSTTEEQAEAERLRGRYRMLSAQVAEEAVARPSPPRSRWLRALKVLAGDDTRT